VNKFVLIVVVAMTMSSAPAHGELLDLASDLTIGSVLDHAKEAAEELITQGQAAANDAIINAGNSLLITVNALSLAYSDQLQMTFDEIGQERASIFAELDELLDQFDDTVEDTSEIVDSFGLIVSKLPGSDNAPAITGISFPPIVRSVGSTTLRIRGFNLEKIPLEVVSEGFTFDLQLRINTEIVYEVSASQMIATDDGGWLSRSPIALRFSEADGILFSGLETNFTLSSSIIDPTLLQARVVFLETKEVRRYEAVPRTISQVQGRQSGPFSYRVDFVPSPPFQVDPNSFRVVDWWEHSECSNDYTRYTLESIDYTGVRVSMVGRRQGGGNIFDPNTCGARLVYEVSVFEVIEESTINTTEWLPLEIGVPLDFQSGAVFSRVEVLLPDGRIVNLDSDDEIAEFFGYTNDSLTNTVYLQFN
jgi:hypothetical protein